MTVATKTKVNSISRVRAKKVQKSYMKDKQRSHLTVLPSDALKTNGQLLQKYNKYNRTSL